MACAWAIVAFKRGRKCANPKYIALEKLDKSNWRGACIAFAEGIAMSFGLYLVGYLIFVIGLAIGAHMLHMPPRWIGVGVLVLAGLGILKAVASTRQRDPN